MYVCIYVIFFIKVERFSDGHMDNNYLVLFLKHMGYVYIYIYVCMYVCMYARMYVHMYVCM